MSLMKIDFQYVINRSFSFAENNLDLSREPVSMHSNFLRFKNQDSGP